MPITIDHFGSVTSNAKLKGSVLLSDNIPSQVGTVLFGRVLENKQIYNQIEDTTGAMHTIYSGDVIAGALGSRRALLGHSGVVPQKIKVGDHLHLLNLGGVIGLATSSSPEVGPATTIEVLGTTYEDGTAVNIKNGPVSPAHFLQKMPPIIAFVGTCMHSGKTQATSTFIAGAVQKGFNVVGLKLTGVALQRDVRRMKSSGASYVYTFNDAGLPSTCGINPVNAAIGCLNQAAKHNPDLIVVEFGDGLLGDYGVDKILKNSQVASAISVNVLAAPDPVAAWGGVQILSNWGLETAVLTGQSTDNESGIDSIRQNTGALAINARNEPSMFVEEILNRIVSLSLPHRMQA